MTRNTFLVCTILCSQALVLGGRASAQTRVLDSPETKQKVGQLIEEVLLPEASLEIDPRHSKLIRTKKPVSRFSLTNPANLEVVQFSPSEFELIGQQAGETTLTLWFGENELLRYLVTVRRDTGIEDRREAEYRDLEEMISEMFPNSVIHLVPIADKLIVRGQARDNEEAARIIGVLTNQAINQAGGLLNAGVRLGTAADPYPGESDLPASNVINMLDVPGEKQVMLKVRVAEMSRSATRGMGFDLNVMNGDFMWQQMLGVAGAFRAVLNTDEVNLALSAISSNSYSKILAEPNLVTLSGRSASFISGGEFAVPIVVGVEGAAAATTNFRGFGTQVNFTPTVIDKDRIRLQVAPSVSAINAGLTNERSGVPGLDTRAVTTTVDLREGQWLAIAGLIQDEQSGSKARVPGLGDIPIVDAVFSRKSSDRAETELIIMVSPELVHPLEDDEAPTILPGMEVTEPGDWQFFLWGNYEGNPTCDHRSTVSNIQMRRGLVNKKNQGFESSQSFYMNGDCGFSN